LGQSLRVCLRIRFGESYVVVFENWSGAYVKYVSTRSAENRVRRPPK
jgi:hypothetical protein